MKINEINIIEPFDEEQSLKLLQQNFQSNDKKFITKLSAVELWANNWPLQDNNIFFFVDNWGKPIGNAIVISESNDTIKKLVRVGNIFIRGKYRRMGIGMDFYSFLLDNGYRIISDSDHTDGSAALWNKLAKKYQVYLVKENVPVKQVTDTLDAYNNGYKLIARNVKL